MNFPSGVSIFDRSVCILLRDEKSREIIRELGVTGVPVNLAADAAFALANPLVVEKAKSRAVGKTSTFRVAVSVRYWPHFSTCSNEEGMARYRRSVAAAVRQLISDGAEVTFISTCQGIAEYDDDSSEARKVIRLLEPDIASQIHIVDDFVRFDELMERLGTSNKIIRLLHDRAKSNPKRIVFAEADHLDVLKAAQIVYDEGIGIPILLGNREIILELMEVKHSIDFKDFNRP